MKTNKLLLASALAASITFSPLASALHTMPMVVMAEGETYDVYQIFTGNIENMGTESVLTNVQFGTGVNGTNLLNALKADGSQLKGEFEKCNTAAEVAEKLATLTPDKVKVFAQIVYENKTDTKDVTGTANQTISVSSNGYYLVVDTAANNAARSLNMLKVTHASKQLTITPKKSVPTVDQRVEDNDADDTYGDDPNKLLDDNGHFYETADWEIGETKKFRIEGTIQNDEVFKEFNQYNVKFEVTPSSGLIYVGNPVVKIKVGDTVSTSNNPTVEKEDTTGKLIFTVSNIKNYVHDETKPIYVILTYDAKLNANALPSSIGSKQDNTNQVVMKYSTNPYYDGTGEEPLGETNKDTVYVFTYKSTNIKYGQNGSEGRKPLANAQFSLHRGAADGAEVKLTAVKNADDKIEIYVLDPTSQNSMIESQTDGTFNIAGLDEGIYYLVEDNAPAGYSKVEPIRIEIKATHYEDGESRPQLDLNSSLNMNNEIIDRAGSALPETGGMGTALIYGAGSVLTIGAAAGWILNRKKRS